MSVVQLRTDIKAPAEALAEVALRNIRLRSIPTFKDIEENHYELRDIKSHTLVLLANEKVVETHEYLFSKQSLYNISYYYYFSPCKIRSIVEAEKDPGRDMIVDLYSENRAVLLYHTGYLNENSYDREWWLIPRG